MSGGLSLRAQGPLPLPPRTPRASLLESDRLLPELQDAVLVVGRPLPVVIHKAHLRERRRARSRRDARERRTAVAELHVEPAGLRREHPIPDRLAGRTL